ncbi:MAG TPA: hypothetical protein VN081_03960 [Dongiaceae bacterium]|nr:hypothetical protein [Dongiaceae bacterium]
MSDPMMSMPYSKNDDPLRRSVDRTVYMQDQIRSGELLRNIKSNMQNGQAKKPIQVLGENG